MDPLSMIVAALVAGASAAAKDTAGEAIKDAYGALKALVLHRLRRDHVPELEHPEARLAVLTDQLRAAGADRDDALVAAAADLLQRVDPGKYHVYVSGGQGVVVGDDANVTMHFGDA